MTNIRMYNNFINRFARGNVPSTNICSAILLNSEFSKVYEHAKYFRNVSDFNKYMPDILNFNAGKFAGSSVVSGNIIDLDYYAVEHEISYNSNASFAVVYKSNFDNYRHLIATTEADVEKFNGYFKKYGYVYVVVDKEGLFALSKRLYDNNINTCCIALADNIYDISITDALFGITRDKAFNGMFDGCGHTLRINDIKAVNNNSCGIFGYTTENAIIKNIIIADPLPVINGTTTTYKATNIVNKRDISLKSLKLGLGDVCIGTVVGKNNGKLENIILSGAYQYGGNFTPDMYYVQNKVNTTNLYADYWGQVKNKVSDITAASGFYNICYPTQLCINSPCNICPYIGYFNEANWMNLTDDGVSMSSYCKDPTDSFFMHSMFTVASDYKKAFRDGSTSNVGYTFQLGNEYDGDCSVKLEGEHGNKTAYMYNGCADIMLLFKKYAHDGNLPGKSRLCTEILGSYGGTQYRQINNPPNVISFTALTGDIVDYSNYFKLTFRLGPNNRAVYSVGSMCGSNNGDLDNCSILTTAIFDTNFVGLYGGVAGRGARGRLNKVLSCLSVAGSENMYSTVITAYDNSTNRGLTGSNHTQFVPSLHSTTNWYDGLTLTLEDDSGVSAISADLQFSNDSVLKSDITYSLSLECVASGVTDAGSSDSILTYNTISATSGQQFTVTNAANAKIYEINGTQADKAITLSNLKFTVIDACYNNTYMALSRRTSNYNKWAANTAPITTTYIVGSEVLQRGEHLDESTLVNLTEDSSVIYIASASYNNAELLLELAMPLTAMIKEVQPGYTVADAIYSNANFEPQGDALYLLQGLKTPNVTIHARPIYLMGAMFGEYVYSDAQSIYDCSSYLCYYGFGGNMHDAAKQDYYIGGNKSNYAEYNSLATFAGAFTIDSCNKSNCDLYTAQNCYISDNAVTSTLINCICHRLQPDIPSMLQISAINSGFDFSNLSTVEYPQDAYVLDFISHQNHYNQIIPTVINYADQWGKTKGITEWKYRGCFWLDQQFYDTYCNYGETAKYTMKDKSVETFSYYQYPGQAATADCNATAAYNIRNGGAEVLRMGSPTSAASVIIHALTGSMKVPSDAVLTSTVLAYSRNNFENGSYPLYRSLSTLDFSNPKYDYSFCKDNSTYYTVYPNTYKRSCMYGTKAVSFISGAYVTTAVPYLAVANQYNKIKSPVDSDVYFTFEYSANSKQVDSYVKMFNINFLVDQDTVNEAKVPFAYYVNNFYNTTSGWTEIDDYSVTKTQNVIDFAWCSNLSAIRALITNDGVNTHYHGTLMDAKDVQYMLVVDTFGNPLFDVKLDAGDITSAGYYFNTDLVTLNFDKYGEALYYGDYLLMTKKDFNNTTVNKNHFAQNQRIYTFCTTTCYTTSAAFLAAHSTTLPNAFNFSEGITTASVSENEVLKLNLNSYLQKSNHNLSPYSTFINIIVPKRDSYEFNEIEAYYVYAIDKTSCGKLINIEIE